MSLFGLLNSTGCGRVVLIAAKKESADLTGKTSGKTSSLLFTDYQAQYMDGLLALNGFLDRLEKYVHLRESGMAPGPVATGSMSLRPEVIPVLREVAIEGEIARGEVFRLIGMSERSGRDILSGLLQEGLLLSDSARGPVRLGFPTHAAGYWFPELYPPDRTAGTQA